MEDGSLGPGEQGVGHSAGRHRALERYLDKIESTSMLSGSPGAADRLSGSHRPVGWNARTLQPGEVGKGAKTRDED